MISPHTPPGTKIVCINAADCEGYLYEGTVYTVREMAMSTSSYDRDTGKLVHDRPEVGVILEEVGAPNVTVFDETSQRHIRQLGWSRRRFRPAELPKCLTELLEITPDKIWAPKKQEETPCATPSLSPTTL